MSRPSDWSPVDLDRDPTPGDPEEIRELAEELQDFADDVGEALGRIRGMASDRAVQEWAGLSAEAFRAEFDGVPGNLDKLQRSYDMAADALARYWPELQTAQGMADRALQRAIDAQAALSSAQTELSGARDWVSRAGDEAERLQDERDQEDAPEPPDETQVRQAVRDHQAAQQAASAAQSRVDNAEADLSAARELARQALEMREEAARTCAQGIDEASDAGIQNRSWWERAIDWVVDNWDTIVDICKAIVAVLGIVVLIIGGPLAWVVLAAALVVLADTLIDYANGRATLWDVAFAALDCIPGMRGLTTLGGLARGLRGLATTGLRGISAGVRGLGQSIRGLGRGMQRLFCRTDPVDMATGEVVTEATDVRLPGTLPLVLARSHRTSVAAGRLFGPSWASTLDQRLILGEYGVELFTEDGMLLHYPLPLPGEPVLPVEGPRWGLSRDGGPDAPMTVHQPDTGRTLHFGRVPGGPGGSGGPGAELPLIAIADRNGNRVRILHAEDGAPAEVVHDGGYRVGVSTQEGRVTALRLLSAPGEPVLLRYGYDERGNLAEVVNSSGLPLRLSYDEAHRLTGWEDRNGTRYHYTYDADGRCVATHGTDGVLASTIAYEPDRYRTEFTDSLGHTTVYQFNDCYQLLTETGPSGAAVHRAYDRYDRLLSLTDPLGNTTRHAYDDRGNPVVLTRPDGARLAMTYNDAGLLTEVTEPDGTRWLREYDAAGNRTAVTDPLGGVVRYAYDDRGAPAAVTDPLGHVTRVTCDAAGLALAVEAPDGAVTRYAYDAFGRITEETGPDGAVSRTEWTPEGKPARHVAPDGTVQTWTWDPEGNCLSHTDPAGAHVAYAYGPFDLPATRTGSDGSFTRYERDTELRLTAVTNALGATWRYTHDAAGNLVAETDFDGRVVRYGYDAAGQLTERVNAAGQRVVLHRNAMGEVVRQESDGRVTTFEHDAAGQLVRAVSPEAELLIERDPLGRVLAETVNGRTTAYAYDAMGRPVRRRTPAGVESLWSYDAAGRPARLTSAGREIAFERDAAGRETRRRIGAGPVVEHRWGPAGTLTGQSVVLGQRVVARREFGYREDGCLTSVADSAAGTTGLRLDAAGRVVAVDAPTGPEAYAYDVAGNQTHARWPAAYGGQDATGERAYEGGRITGAGRTRYEYDAAGRIVVRRRARLSKRPEEWRYTWDAEDRLTSVTTPDGARWEYRYDPLGRRIGKRRVAGDGTTAEWTAFVWSGTQLIEQIGGVGPEGTAGEVASVDRGAGLGQGAGGETSSLTWEFNGLAPLAQIEGHAPGGGLARVPQEEIDRRFYALITDLVGTPTRMVDEAGEVVRELGATLWGRVPGAPAGAADTPLRFPGQYADAESGLHYNVHRYYDPETARYLTPDPLGLTPAPNPHVYPHNPHTWADPLGLAPCMVDLYHGTFGAAATNIRANGIDLAYSTRNMDFGRGGFYVTNSRRQAEDWAQRLAGRNGDTPAVLHFRVPRSELDSFNRRLFDGPSDELADFIRHHRNGGAMHNYDMVEGPMLLNVGPFLRRGADPVFGGHQIAIFSPDAASLFNRSLQ
ncbi:RHS repeat-associated core domain-containing protein [Streptomyces sp. DSM 44917]|uniref:RHS repeat-associated core domain-containing protein n=1 Tax=Streptomyces boetiae TaxID=3075541 RepID=A0ABU2L753_9ACTN|nr:RHS repeat-associated core domain-containing protein [Streptomyces sp. DSM 44917]MDT0307400.1 RHS repeat-associated core domain-containing protein [Streptomyces sp. DSM 44917]